jgi:hypothetical protein
MFLVMRSVKGMVLVSGGTYRITRIEAGCYDVWRILDDQRVGRFRVGPPLEVEPAGNEADLLREIARAAVQSARTSWVGRLSV